MRTLHHRNHNRRRRLRIRRLTCWKSGKVFRTIKRREEGEELGFLEITEKAISTQRGCAIGFSFHDSAVCDSDSSIGSLMTGCCMAKPSGY